MPLAVQAILPLTVLLAGAVLVRARPRHPDSGAIACVATAIAAVITLVELLRLSPGEHVDVPYVTTFPYADLVVRLDGLSLAFATVTLTTAALLMLVRLQDRRDRRDPWLGWLLTSAAACGLILAANLLLLFILLQVLTLAWTGSLDERAPRRRGVRLTLQIADIGLLLAAASAIQSVGTSAFSGVPSDTFGVATFWLMLLPVIVRIAILGWGSLTPVATVTLEPAVAWLAPAAYILLRLLALMGGRLPDRPTAVILFVGAAAMGIGFASLAFWRVRATALMPMLLAAQAALALALSAGSEPLLTIASTWLWLLLIPLAGLISVRMVKGSAAELPSLVQLAMVPASLAFVGVWLGGLTLSARGLLAGMIPVAIAIVICLLAATSAARLPERLRLDPPTCWAAALMLIAAFPILAMERLVIPAASTVRLVPSGTLSVNPLGISTNFGVYPALLVSLAGLLAIALVLWLVRERRVVIPPPRPFPRVGGRWGPRITPAFTEASQRWAGLLGRRTVLRSSPFVLWGIFAVVAAVAVIRP